MKLQGNTTMKTNVKKIAILSLIGAATVGLSACGGGGGSDDHTDPNKSDLISTGDQINASTYQINFINNGLAPTGTLSITKTGNGAFQFYDGTSETSWCTPTTCPNVCQSMTKLVSGGQCNVYINAKNNIAYSSAAVNETGGVSVTDLATSRNLSFTLKNTGGLYAIGQNNVIYAKANNDSSWTPTLGLPAGVTNISAFAVDNNGIVYLSNGTNIYRSDYGNSGWANIGQPNASVTDVKAIAFDQNNQLYSGGIDSNKIYTYQNGSWSEDTTVPSPSVSVTHIGFSSTNTMVASTFDGSKPHVFTKPVSVNWINIGTGDAAANQIYGFGVAPNGEVYTTYNNSGKYYSNATSTTSWTDQGNVKDASTSVFSFNVDQNGNLYAGVGNNGEIRTKVGGGAWQDLATPASTIITSINNGSLLTVTKE